MPARAATAIAGGASSALAGVAPAPIVASTKPITKNMTGSTPAWPRHSRTARSVKRASVPLTSAIENSSVTPTSVTSRSTGKPVEHLARRHAAEADADDERQRERQHADVDRRRAAQRDGEDERRDGDPREAHLRQALVFRRRRGERTHERRDVGEALEPVDELEHLVDRRLAAARATRSR